MNSKPAIRADAATLWNSLIAEGLAPFDGYELTAGWHRLSGDGLAKLRATGASRDLLGHVTVLAAQAGPAQERFRKFIEATQAALPLLAEPQAPDDRIQAQAELNSFYALAQQIWKHPELVELVIDRTSPGALRGIEDSRPDLAAQVRSHVEDFGWLPLRTRGGAMDFRHVMQRLQKIFLRWKPDDVQGWPVPDSPSPPCGLDLLLAAEHRARPLLEQVAAELGTDAGLLAFHTHREIIDALAGTRNSPEKAEERRKALPEALRGQAVSLGRGAGRVRVVTRAAEGAPLDLGDVLVSGLSSPDHGGRASIFPTRTEAAVDLRKVAAVVLDEGGLLSHAAMICREHGIPCLVNTERATITLADGDYVEVDASKGDGSVRRFTRP
ncbi:MAG: PEP-utilizing enzyme [Actinomycetota bacterium]